MICFENFSKRSFSYKITNLICFSEFILTAGFFKLSDPKFTIFFFTEIEHSLADMAEAELNWVVCLEGRG